MTIYCQHCRKVAVDPAFRDCEGQEEAEQAVDLWQDLLKAVNAEPCKYPALRDSFHDWFEDWKNNRDADQPDEV